MRLPRSRRADEQEPRLLHLGRIVVDIVAHVEHRLLQRLTITRCFEVIERLLLVKRWNVRTRRHPARTAYVGALALLRPRDPFVLHDLPAGPSADRTCFGGVHGSARFVPYCTNATARLTSPLPVRYPADDIRPDSYAVENLYWRLSVFVGHLRVRLRPLAGGPRALADGRSHDSRIHGRRIHAPYRRHRGVPFPGVALWPVRRHRTQLRLPDSGRGPELCNAVHLVSKGSASLDTPGVQRGRRNRRVPFRYVPGRAARRSHASETPVFLPMAELRVVDPGA